MDRKQALDRLKLMQAWHEDNGDGPNADYDAICFAIEAIERSEDLKKLITALEQEHAKLREMQSATDINVGTTDTISRQATIDALENDMASLDHIIKGMSANDVRLDAYVSQRNQVNYDIYTINNIPPVTPKQRTGEYVHVSGYDDQYKCTACGIDIIPMRVVKFCSECGAKILKMTSGKRIIYPWEGDAE